MVSYCKKHFSCHGDQSNYNESYKDGMDKLPTQDELPTKDISHLAVFVLIKTNHLF